jgi:hypothetical protein
MKYSREYWIILKEVVDSNELNIRDKIITVHNIIRTISCPRCLNHYLTRYKTNLLGIKDQAELLQWFQQFYFAANDNKNKFALNF